MEGASAAALEFLILTVARTGEIIGARWSEINLKDRVWVVPAARMKSGREHRYRCHQRRSRFSSECRAQRMTTRLSGSDLRTSLQYGAAHVAGRMNRGDITAHGFRSTFRDWAAERSNFAREVVEMALAQLSKIKRKQHIDV